MTERITPSPPAAPRSAMSALHLLDRIAGVIAEACGQLAALAATAMVVASAALVLAFSLGYGSVKLQDFVLWLNAGMVMLGLAYALKHRTHVRIDVFSAHWSERTRARVEVLGVALLLLPFCVAIVVLSLDFVAMSWAVRERSASTGGLAGLYLAKTLLPLGAALLALQGVAEGLRALPAALGGAAHTRTTGHVG